MFWTACAAFGILAYCALHVVCLNVRVADMNSNTRVQDVLRVEVVADGFHGGMGRRWLSDAMDATIVSLITRFIQAQPRLAGTELWPQRQREAETAQQRTGTARGGITSSAAVARR